MMILLIMAHLLLSTKQRSPAAASVTLPPTAVVVSIMRLGVMMIVLVLSADRDLGRRRPDLAKDGRSRDVAMGMIATAKGTRRQKT